MRKRDMEEDEDSKPAEAKDYYNKQSLWWPESDQTLNEIDLGCNSSSRCNNLNYESKGILTPEIWVEPLESILVNDDKVSEVGDKDNVVKVELDEITSEQEDRNCEEDIYVAVGKDDMEVVKWVLHHHAVSPASRIFLVHVSPPVTLIPTPVGMFQRSQLSQQQVRIYEEDEINRKKHLLHKYIQLSNDAQVTAETLLLESNDTAKAILDLIPIRNINNLVIGIKRPPHSRGKNKLSKGDFVKKNAPEFCDVTLVYDDNQALNDSKVSCLHCMCFSGSSGQVSD